MKKWMVVLVIFLISIPLVFAGSLQGDLGGVAAPDENTTVKVVYEGNQTITAALVAAAAEKSKTELDTYEKAVVLAVETDKVLAVEKYPYVIEKTEITILKYRCTGEICGYWIEAYRTNEKGEREEVATNSPIWISPPPYEYQVSESFDSVKNEQTVVLKEDPKVAVEQVLQQYVSRQGLGKAVTGTKE